MKHKSNTNVDVVNPNRPAPEKDVAAAFRYLDAVKSTWGEMDEARELYNMLSLIAQREDTLKHRYDRDSALLKLEETTAAWRQAVNKK